MRLFTTEFLFILFTTSTQHTGRSPRVDLADDCVGRGVNHRDLVRVILRHVELVARSVERHPECVTVEHYPPEQMARAGGGNVDSYDFTIAIGGHIGRTIALYDYRKRVGAADPAGRALVIGKIRAQIVLVADGSCCGVDHADRIVVVVGHDKRLAVGGNAHAAGVRLDTETDALAAVPQGDRRR